MRPPAVSGSPSEDAGQLLEVDGQRPQHRRRAAAEQSINLVGQLIIPAPASPAERNHEITSQLGGFAHTLHEGSDKTVAGQLERVIVGADAAEQVDDSRPVTAVDGRPQGGALLLGVHLAHEVWRCPPNPESMRPGLAAAGWQVPGFVPCIGAGSPLIPARGCRLPRSPGRSRSWRLVSTSAPKQKP
jgi:hypothetical protein